MKIYLELDYEESVLVLWALKDLYQFNAEIANDEYLQRLQGLIKKAGDSADKLYEFKERLLCQCIIMIYVMICMVRC